MGHEGILITGLSKHFPDSKITALRDIEARIEPGRITGVVGPDGAGKTTLLRLIAGLFIPTTGDILVRGLNTQTQAPQIQTTLGYMPQKFGLYEDLSVEENLILHAQLKGLPKSKLKETFETFYAFTRLGPFKDRFAGNLSGGMKQKLGLACALLKEPKILLLDEPSVGVDPLSRRDLWAMVKAFTQNGTTVVWSTAYLDEAQLCDDVLVLNEGRLLYTGPPHTLTKRMEGRIFQTAAPVHNKRAVLQKILEAPEVMDGLIQGKGLRVLLKQGATPDDIQIPEKPQEWVPSPPHFEDAFLDILGGIKERKSILASLIPPLPASDESVISAQDLTKRFGAFTAVSHVNFQIKPGEIFGFLGPNGAGKSTTFKMLCGLLTPTDGRALVFGRTMRTANALAKRRIGYMAQKFSLYGDLSVKQNLDFFSGAYGLYGKEQANEINAMVETFELTPYLDTAAQTLPLGFKQRLALACSVMHRPEILFLDEPTSGVDPITRREFWLHINGMVEKGVTVMVTTHFLDEAEFCDRACLIYRGKMIALGSPDELKEMARTKPDHIPSLEDTFIELIQRYDKENPLSS
ncbi:MAG: multidrug ABC transporter ATP-binding protein [Candidatus Puniceispirillum sp.]|nr:multidrug ABC transporter ATP-binding protein [Candidatus Puniceispirillum sp.]